MVIIFLAAFAYIVTRLVEPRKRPIVYATVTALAALLIVLTGIQPFLTFDPILSVSMGVPLLFLGIMSSSTPPREVDPQEPQILSYRASYIIAVIVFVAETGITLIDGVYAAGNGAMLGLTPQVHAWIGVLGPLLGAVAGLLPAVVHTPARRVAELLRATRGLLPQDAIERT